MTDLFRQFAALHVPGAPLILFNVWDAGSAKTIAAAGATAIATGSWGVAASHGLGDGEKLSIDLALANAIEVVGAVALPVTIDFEGAYAVAPHDVATNAARLIATGAIGCNFEDQMIGGEGLHSTRVQQARIASMRQAVGPDFFINARTDIFMKAARDAHDDALTDEAITRGLAYQEAGANGLFVPGLVDLKLIGQICAAVALPVNALTLPGAPSASAFAKAGVARISYGPGPYRLAMQALGDSANAALTR